MTHPQRNLFDQIERQAQDDDRAGPLANTAEATDDVCFKGPYRRAFIETHEKHGAPQAQPQSQPQVQPQVQPQPQPPQQSQPQPQPYPDITIFDLEKARQLHANSEHDRDKSLLKRVIHNCPQRPLARYGSDYLERLNALDERFPNFAEVTAFLRGQYHLSQLGSGVVKAPPMLLNGPPGVGKTLYVKALAKLWQTGFVPLAMNNAQSDAALSGLDHIYDTSRAGAVFNSLVLEGETANPVVFLDELDKAPSHDPRYNVHNALLTLLEPHTAERFRDMSLPDLPINARHVIWVSTSNDMSDISEPLLSRVEVFDISKPNAEQARKIVHSVYQNLREENDWGAAMAAQLGDLVVEALLKRTPREIRRLLLAACARAATEGRRTLRHTDVPNGPRSGPFRLGFVS